MKNIFSLISIPIIILGIILIILWFFGFILGFLPVSKCHTGRIIMDNWVTGLGYQLTCKR